MIRSLSMVVAILTTAFCLAWQQPAVPSDTTAPSPTDEAVLSEYKKFVGHWKLVDATRKEVLPQGGETYISEYRIVDGQLIKRYTSQGHLGNLLISLDISDPAESRHRIMMTENNPFRLKQSSRGLYVFEKADLAKGIPERLRIVFNDQGGYPDSIDSPNTHVTIYERVPPAEASDHFKIARADGQVVITLSADNRKAMGYTGNTAEGIPLELDPSVSIQPAVEAYQQYGIVQHGPHQHVFSGRLRQWVTLTLPEPGFPEPMQRDGMIELTSPSKGTFTYDDSVGRWMTTEELKSQALARLSSVLHPGANTAAGEVRTISSGESARSNGETQRTDHKPASNAPAAKQAIVVIIDPAARQSEVVKQVVEALEKAGIAKADSPDKVTPSTSAIHVTLSMRADESYEKIKHLVQALQSAGVEQLSFQAGGVQEAGKEAQNHIRLIAQPNSTTEELHRIEQAITASAKQSGLTFVLSTQIPGQENAPAYDPSATPAIEPQSVPPEPPVNVPQTKETPDPDYEKIVILRIEGGPEHYAMLRPLETALGKLRIALAPVDLSVNKPDGKDDFHVDLAMRTEESPENIAKLIGWLTELKVYDFTLSTKENPTNVVLIQVWNETVAVQHLIESLQEASKSPVKFNFVRRDQPKSQDPSLTRKNNQEIATSVADALTKVKLAGSKGIEIRLQDGVCTLTGEVASDADVALAGDVAGIVMGVTTVKNQLTSKVVQNKDDTSEVKVFALQHAQATEVAEVLKQVYDKGPAKIVPDARTNSVIVTGPEAQLEEIEALLLKLDEAGSVKPTVGGIPVENEAAKQVVQLQDELAQLRQSVANGESLPHMNAEWYAPDRETPYENPTPIKVAALSSDEVIAVAKYANSLIAELQKEQDSVKRGNPTSPRIANLDATIAMIKALYADVFTQAPKEEAKLIEGMKEYTAMMPPILKAARAELDRLIKENPTDPRIRELDITIAQLNIQQRQAQHLGVETVFGGLPTASAAMAIPVTDHSAKELQQQLAQLRKEYEAAEAEAHKMASQLQRDDNGDGYPTRNDLRQAVQRAFTARQSLLRAELMEMQSRLLQTQRSIEMRERISDQIIQRRVEDLLNPQLEWDGNSPAGPPLSKAADAKPSDTRRVLVAVNDIRPGERLVEGKNVAFKEFPQSALVTYNGDLVHSPDDFSVRVAATIPYRADDLIRKTRLTEMGQYGSGSSQIPRGKRVFTFNTNDTHIHAGLLRPGDKVDVTVTFVDRKGNLVTKVLLECIDVFATGFKTVYSDENQNKQPPRSVSLLVTPEQDGFVKIAQSKGQLALSLRHPDDDEVNNLNGINSAIMEDLQRSIGHDDFGQETELVHDPKAMISAKLQGIWDVEVQSSDLPKEKLPFKIIAEIRDNVMTWSFDPPQPDNDNPPVFQIKLGELGTPQSVDLVSGPNDGEDQRAVLPGIMEVGQDLVRICVNVNSHGTRPEVLVAGKNVDIYTLRRLSQQNHTPQPAAAPEPDRSQTAMLVKLQGQWHLTIHPTSALGMGLFLKDSEEAEAVIEGQVMKVFYKKALGANLLEDDRDPFLAYTVKITFGETGSPQPVDLLFGPNEEPVNRRLALGIAEFSDDVIRLCFDRATESESIRPEVFAVGAKGEIWELRREPPTGSRGYVLDRLQGVWQGTWQPDFTLPADVDVPTIDGIVRIQGSRMAVSWQPDEEIEVRLGASGSAQNIDLLFKDRKTKATNELLGVVDVSGEEIILRLGDCNEEDRPKSIVGTKDEATFTLKLSKLPPGAFPDLGAQCELAGPLPQGAGQGKFRGGLRIAKVFAGTPAAQGGFVVGDVLVGFHVWEITRLEELQYALAQKLKGEVSFHVIRRGVVRKGYVLLDGSRRPDTDAELSPDQLTSIPVEYDRGIAIPVAQLQKVIPNAQER